MPQVQRDTFLMRLNPLDLSMLTLADLEPLERLLLSGELDKRYARFESRLVTLVQVARDLHMLARAASWQARMDHLASLDHHNLVWAVTLLSLSSEDVRRASVVRETALRAHEMLQMPHSSYGLLRRERRVAWRDFARIMAPAIRRGIHDHLRSALAH